jgi:hypothetical protein
MEKLHIVTVATDSEYYFPYLVESCKRNGKELEVLGMGEKWQGFNWKYVKMMEYLKNLPTDDIVCFVDGYDIICCRNLNELVDEFKEIKERTGCKIVVGNDKDKTSIIENYLILFYFGKCKNKQINSGTYIGYVKDVLEIIEKIYELNPKNDADDQILMIQYCNKTENEIYCDTESKLFLSLCFPLEEIDKYMDIDENTKIVTYESNKPFFIHANGYGYLDNVISKLGYDIEKDKIKNELFRNYFEKKVFMYLKMFFLQYYFVFLLIFLIIIYIIYFKNINKLITKITKSF